MPIDIPNLLLGLFLAATPLLAVLWQWQRRLQLLQQELSDYLCPWTRAGQIARFGWELRPQLLQSFIQQRPYIDYVTDFSLLHISEYGSRQYRMLDSACFSAGQQPVLDIFHLPRLHQSSPPRAAFTSASIRPCRASVVATQTCSACGTDAS